MVKCKYEGTGIWDGRCIGTKEVDPCPGYDKCKQYKPNYTTNADRIRSMNDEELAKFLDMCESMGYEDSSIATDSSGHCMDMLEWLKQPPKGE